MSEVDMRASADEGGSDWYGLGWSTSWKIFGVQWMYGEVGVNM